jgi:hypothetical protein
MAMMRGMSLFDGRLLKKKWCKKLEVGMEEM